jgi:Sugar-transfer associated ATP-grasp
MSLSWKSAAKAFFQSFGNLESRYHDHWAVNRRAMRILKNVESYKGKTSRQDLKQCNDYAVEVLGHKRFAPWLYVYTAVSGRFKEGWIPDNYFRAIVVPKLQRRYGPATSLRGLSAAMLQSAALPDMLAYANGIFFDTAYRFVSPDAVKGTLFKDQERVVFKLDNSLQGLGIYFFTRESFDLEQIQQLGNGVFQRVVRPHPLFAEFTKQSVATLRITTVYEDGGKVSVRACYLRLGSGDETHVQSKSQVTVSIHIESGAFQEVGYVPGWFETRIHPASHVAFAGKVIPAFRACVRTVTELHRKAPYTRCIGWDVTVDRDENVQLLEWNGARNGIKFSEATQGPCFADLAWERLWKREW